MVELAVPALVQPVIETQRFVLRPLRASDAGLIAHYTGDKRVAEGTRAIAHPMPPGSTQAFIARLLAEGDTAGFAQKYGAGT